MTEEEIQITETTEVADQPRRRVRRSTKATVTEPEAAQAPELAGETPKPRRGRPKKEEAGEAAEGASASSVVAGEVPVESQATAAEEPPKRRRGRPRKVAVAEADSDQAAAPAQASESIASEQAASEPAQEEPPKRRRGRPRKVDVLAQEAKTEQASEPAEQPAAESAENPESEGSQQGKAQAKQPARTRDQQRNGRQNNNRHNRRNRRDREVAPSVTIEELSALKVAELRERAAELELDVIGLKKAQLVEAVFAASVKAEGFLEVEGVLDILSDGYGFLRTSGYLPGESDCYVGTSLIKRNGLRKGDYICGTTRPARENEKFAAIQKISTVNGLTIEQLASRPRFADLTPVYPSDRLIMEHGKNTITSRVIDLVAPIGKGQRGLIVSPPKAGKTTILKDIAASISANNPEVHLMCLLVDERPEEVTDMQRSIKGEVVSSTFDMPADNHIAVAEMVIERAKRLVECGEDVVILLDSITRLARAYNLAQPASGRVLSGGVDSTALYPPKRFLGAARNIENGGSLTILASALIETGSKMDEVIFEEFKGTGNMELRLDRALADRRIFPAIDPVTSGTRKEDLLLDPQMAPLIWAVRRILANLNNTERAMDTLIKSLKQTEDNDEFLMRTARKAQHSKTETLEF